MNNITLAIRHLPRELRLLSQDGLYWLAVEHSVDAEILARQCLEALPAVQPCTLICADMPVEGLLAPLASHAGPAQLQLFELEAGQITLALRHFVSELKRLAGAHDGVILFMLPAASWGAFDTEAVMRWATELNDWLGKHRSKLLLVCHGPGWEEQPAALPAMAQRVRGLSRLYRQGDDVFFHLYHLHNALGMHLAQCHKLELRQTTFEACDASLLVSELVQVEDKERYLLLRTALEGLPQLSPNWVIFDTPAALWSAAADARAATLVLAIDDNRQIEALAQQLHAARSRGGKALKIAVRELSACLRHNERQLLLACGANMIIPSRTPAEHFLILLDGLQGQLWFRTSGIDIESLVRRLRTPRVRGLLSPREFLHQVDELYQARVTEICHQLLELPIRRMLTVEQCLGQLSLSRFGDVACILDGHLYLFLFTCRNDGLDAALAHICRLPWQDLFSDRRSLESPDALPRAALAQATAVPVLDDENDADESAPFGYSPVTEFAPRRVTLKRAI
ncbi:BcsE family c-di-GMP-binding protein [Zobellella iuensis]|uniref:Cellulose biosynthesis protein BcsE n=1 Tax=Zobellella iuensis TaxID=2803811 RepID=A0ABS1QX84_9GAMM|nr:BcsE family c-di-GMP-binding protein [Zobellella iuensis]MBL1379051.1 hypothetical protein [Zobellella iuensis]